MGTRRRSRGPRTVATAVLAAAMAACGLTAAAAPPAAAATTTRTMPAATLGIYTSAEDSGSYATVPGQHPNIANYYLAWGQAFPTQFIESAEAAGATPYIEIEPWHAGPSWDLTPSMVDIGNNASSDCGSDGTSSCEAWLDSIGQDVASFSAPIIFTFAHEFNVSGQYPWSYGDSEGTTPAQWITAWDTVRNDINGSGGRPYTWWMWAPNVDTGGTTTAFAPWWPGAANVDMVGIDGYPDSEYGLDTFQELFGQSFTEMHALTSLPIFISETNLAVLTGTGGYEGLTQFIQDALADGATGVLEFEDGGAPTLTTAQWAQLDAALGLPSGTGTGTGGSGGTPPKATLGIYINAEDSGTYSTDPGQHPNIANYYLAWGQAFPTQFIDEAEAAGATPFIEIEPWHAGPSWDLTPSMVDIGNNASSDCGSNGTSSCEAWLDSIGQDVASFGAPIIFTFAHEFNVSGQYPWSYGDSEGTTPAQWITAWDTVRNDINGSGGSGYAYWMWNPNVDTGGTTTAFAPWWPGAANVDMVGVDGFPDASAGLDTFQQVFGQSFTEMQALTSLPIFIASTNLSSETGTGGTQTVTQFVQAALADGASGLLEYEDGAPALTSSQWSQLDAALGLS